MTAGSGNLAEREGFEPPNPDGLTVFKTAAIDRSATSPNRAGATLLHTARSLPKTPYRR